MGGGGSQQQQKGKNLDILARAPVLQVVLGRTASEKLCVHFLLMSTRVTKRAVHSPPGREKWTYILSTFQMAHFIFRIIIRKNSRGLSFSFFNWSIVALQRCVSFCGTAKWITYTDTYIASSLNVCPIWVTAEH